MKNTTKPAKDNGFSRLLKRMVRLLKNQKTWIISSFFVCGLIIIPAKMINRCFYDKIGNLPIFWGGMLYAYYLTWLNKK